MARETSVLNQQNSGLNSALATAGRVGRVVLDALLPPQCMKCGALVADQGGLCGVCWPKLTFLGPPQCAQCGLPFEHDFSAGDSGDGMRCGDCLRRPPAYRCARAAVAYDDESRGVLLAFKHGDRTDMTPALGGWLARAGAGLTGVADLIVPVPLHWTRLWRRRFNQSALLALALGRLADVPVDVDLLARAKRTRSQGGLGRGARRRNVQGAFRLRRRANAMLAGRRVLLVDDVMTTGATVEACAKVLVRGGAVAVDVLTLARVCRPLGN